MRVTLRSEAHFRFAASFLHKPKIARSFANDLSFEIIDPFVACLFSRLDTADTVVLPYIGDAKDVWIIAGKSRRDLNRAMSQVSRFVIPTYAEFDNSTRTPEYHLFDPEGNDLQRYGCQLFPAGYYRWRSPAANRERILKRLGLWLTLQSKQPAPHIEQRVTFRDLHDLFNAALAAHNWQEAELVLGQIERQHLSTADNLAFLRVQLLAQQGRWRSIWESLDFANTARLRVPRAVRTALLTAFYQVELLQFEQEQRWQDALQAFSAARPRLGELLTTRLGITEPSVVKVFAYQAVLAYDRPAFEALLDQAAAQDVQALLRALEPLLPAPSPPTLVLTPLQQARLALDAQDFDAAAEAAERIESVRDRSRLLVTVAAHSADALLAARALYLFRTLPEEEQAYLRNSERYLRYDLEDLEGLTATDLIREHAPTPTSIGAIDTWLDWFDILERDPSNKALGTSIDRLAASSDDRFWTSDAVLKLNDCLLPLVLEPSSSGRALVKSAISALANYFLKDSLFPRPDPAYAELYETLYTAFLGGAKPNVTNCLVLLRLAEARLMHDPSHCSSTYESLRGWLGSPIPAIEPCILEALELFADYGIQPAELILWYREWVDYLLQLPTTRDRTALETWRLFGKWVQPGEDLLRRISEAVASTLAKLPQDPVRELPDGFRIGLYTLRPASALRAREMLLQRNPHLNIQICVEHDVNDQARAIASNSDLVVIVTTSLTHSLFYGIQPYLRSDPVYPQSSGSTSIIRAIESTAAKLPQPI